MRQVIRATFRFLVGTSTFVAVAVPTTLLGGWSIIYIAQVVEHASAPGIPIEVQYETEQGMARLSAKSYAVSFDSGSSQLRILAFGLSIRDQTGAVIGSLDRLDATSSLPPQKARVLVTGGTLNVVRKPNGKFNFERILPKTQDTGPETFAEIHAKSIVIRYADETRRPSLNETVRLNRGRARVLGSNATATLDLEIDGFGKLPLEVTSLKDGPALIEGDFKQNQIRRGWDQAQRWLDPAMVRSWGTIGAESIQATGPFWVRIQKGSAEFGAECDVSASGVRVQDILESASVQGKMVLSQNRIRTDFVTREPGRTAQVDGLVDWSGPLRLGGNVKANLASGRAAWKPLRDLLPAEVQVGASEFKGAVSLDRSGWRVNGSLDVAQSAYSGETLVRSRWKLGLDDNRLVAELMGGRWADRKVSGKIGLDFQSGKIGGAFALGQGDLESLARRYGRDDLKGVVSADAMILGTLAKPKVEVSARGGATWIAEDGREVVLGIFQGQGTLDAKQATLKRLVLSGPNGAITGRGAYSFNDQKVNLSFDAGSLDLPAILPDWSGVGFASAQITGSLSKPIITGKVEAYGLQYDTYRLPVASATFEWKDDVLSSVLQGETGNTQASGWASWNSKTDAVQGAFDAKTLTLSDWLGDRVNGAATANNLVLSGTLQQPLLAGQFESEGTSFDGVLADRIEGKFRLDREKIEVDAVTVKQDDAVARLSGWYGFKDQEFEAQGNFNDADLSRFVEQTPELRVEGQADGSFSAKGRKGELTDLRTGVTFRNVSVNESNLGGGEWLITGRGGQFEGEGTLATLGRAMRIDQARFDSSTQAISANVDLFNFDLESLIGAASKWTAKWPDQTRQLLAQTKGRLFAEAKIGGTRDQLVVDIPKLTINTLEINGRNGGDIEAKGKFENKNILLESFDWTLEPGTETRAASRMIAKGTVDAEGKIKASGELTNFDLSWIPTLTRTEFQVAGNAEQLIFDVAGTTDDPEFTGSLQASTLGLPSASGGFQQLPAKLLLDQVTYKSGFLNGSGSYFYEGFSGPFEFGGPLEALHSSTTDSIVTDPFLAKIDLRERPLSELGDLFPQIDANQSKGSVKGNAQVEINNGQVKVSAKILAKADELAIKDFEDRIRNISAELNANETSASFVGRLSPGQGGDISWDLTTDFTELIRNGSSLEDAFDQARINGKIQALAVQIDQALKNSLNKADGRVFGAVDGEIGVSGPIKSPLLSNLDAGKPIRFSSGFLSLPSDFPVSDEKPTYNFDPRFGNLRFAVDPGTELRSSIVNLFLNGSGSLGGRLSAMNLGAEFQVESGTLQLPTTRVTLEDTSKIGLSYQTTPDGRSDGRVDLNLEGRTSVSARRFDSIERYDVNLQVRGDLLDPRNTLSFTATSDPPDLSQEQILALIGQKEFIEGLASNVFRNRGAVEGALLGFTLQNWLSPLTKSLAGSLKLDYLAAEYNPIDGFSMVAAKTFGAGFTLQFRRQITSTIGQENDYELKLSYRPRLRGRALERTRFGLATDNKRPWKITFEYSIRL